ncbi:MAG: mechanosensitive ion channel [Planctomycetota bacterium]|nr:mechanosensitive ion channel [Planctomycetota bacterium]
MQVTESELPTREPTPFSFTDWSEMPPAVGFGITWLGVLIAAWIANFVAKKIIVRAVRAVIGRTRAKWDDVLVENKVFERLSHLAPALVFYVAAPWLFPESQAEYAIGLRRVATVWMFLAGARAGNALFESFITLGRSQPAFRDKPLRSYAQVLSILLWLGVGIVSIATLMDKSPWALLTGLGAMTAILLLVFKDSLLGFVASVQIAGNDMLRIGDWVEMPKYGADGDVLDIGLNTVKIQNWDKTVSTIPTYAFMTDSFKNWRGMTESGGRRIKRSIVIDMSSIRFLDQADLDRLRQVQCIADYLEETSKEAATWNAEQGIDDTSMVNGRHLTNLGTFRAYISNYLERNPQIRKDMTFLVRQLAPGAQGLPIEIYVFSGEQRWVQYEGILADIFDHLLAAIGEFDLRVYQQPSGSDVAALRGLAQ